MTDSIETQNAQPTPNPDLKTLERLVGTWKISGDTEGESVYEWMDGGFFLIQHVTLSGEKGIEIIGHVQGYNQPPSPEIRSRYYGNKGATFDYVYEVEGDTLWIWFGDKGSPAYYKGTFSEGGNTLTGDWVYPGGGGYSTVTTRVR